MSIRPAKAADTMAVIRLMQEALGKSIYAGKSDVHKDMAKALLVRCVTLHEHHSPGGTLYLLSETDGKVQGYFIAMLAPVYVVGTMLEAQDIHCYMSADADRRDYHRLLDAFDAWADSNPKVVDAVLSNSDFIAGMSGRVASVYRRRGYELTNSVYKRRIARCENIEEVPFERSR